MLVEDLHWLDRGSETFLENLVKARPRAARAGGERPSAPSTTPTGPTGRTTASCHSCPSATMHRHELLRDLLGFHPSLDGVADLVRDRTGGNPFFMEEVVQDWWKTGACTVSEAPTSWPARSMRCGCPPPCRLSSVPASTASRSGRSPCCRGRRWWADSSPGGSSAESLGTGRRRARRRPPASWSRPSSSTRRPSSPRWNTPSSTASPKRWPTRSQLARSRAAVHTAVAQALAELDPEKHDERASLVAHHFETRW